MKVLVVDGEKHEELEYAMGIHNITLEYVDEIKEDFIPDEFQLVVLCPKDEAQLSKMFQSTAMQNMNVVVLYEKTDDRFINYCANLGCIDVIKRPYNPQSLAKRLVSLIEGLSDEGIDDLPKESVEWNAKTEAIIKREIKRASRAKEPVAFLIGRSVHKERIYPERAQKVLDQMQHCFRETDFITYYKQHILVVLPGCRRDDLPRVEAKLLNCASGQNIAFFSIVLDGLYKKPVHDEPQQVLTDLLEGINDLVEKQERRVQ